MSKYLSILFLPIFLCPVISHSIPNNIPILSSIYSAQSTPKTSVVQGYVRDKSTHLAISNTTVRIDELRYPQITDENGFFQFQGISQSIHNISIILEYYVSPYVTFDATSQDTVNLTFDLQPGGGIHGTVMDQYHQPVNTAGVELIRSNTIWMGQLQNNGKFTYKNLELNMSPAIVKIDATPLYDVSSQTNIFFPPGQKDINLTFVLTSSNSSDANLGNVAGKVSSESGSPVSKAIVAYNHPISKSFLDTSKYVPTDSQGYYSIQSVLLKDLRLMAKADGYSPSYASLYNTSHDTVVNFTLSSSHFVGGKVIDQGGNPIKDVRIEYNMYDASYLFYNLKRNYSSDSLGMFMVDGLSDGLTHFNFQKEGYTPVMDTTLDSDKNGYIITLEETGGISGTVVDTETGTPVPKFMLFVKTTKDVPSPMRNTYSYSRLAYNGLTFFKDDGTFSVKNLPTSIKYHLVVRAEGYRQEDVEPVDSYSKDAQSPKNLIIKLKKITPTEGIVEDFQTGKGIPGVWVSAVPFQDYNFSWIYMPPEASHVTTDNEGHFRYDKLSISKGILALQKQGYGKIFLENTDFTGYIRVRLNKAATVTVIFSKDSSHAYNTTGAMIALTKYEGAINTNFNNKYPEIDGKCFYSDLPPGNYRIYVRKKTGGITKQFTLVAGQNYILDMSAVPLIRVLGHITYKGIPSGYAGINTYNQDTPALTTNVTADTSGNYEIALPEPGNYKFGFYNNVRMGPQEINQNSYTNKTLSVESGDYRLDVNLPDSAIQGLVMSPKTGKPLSKVPISAYMKKKEYDNYSVNLSPHSDYTTAVWTLFQTFSTNQNGQFSFDPLEAGQWLIAIEQGTANSFISKPFQLHTSETKNDFVIMKPSTGILNLSVLDSDSGNRLHPSEIACADSTGFIYSFPVDTTDTVIYPALPVGHYRIYARSKNYLAGFIEADIVDGSTTQSIIKLKKGGRLVLPITGTQQIADKDKVLCICKIQQAKNGAPILEDTNGGYRREIFTLTSHSENTCTLALPPGEYTVEVQTRMIKYNTYVSTLLSRNTKLIKIEQDKDFIWVYPLEKLKK